MPDSGITDGTTFTSSFWDTYARQQVVTQCTSGARPTGVEGRLISETDTDRIMWYTGAAWDYVAEPPQTWSVTSVTQSGAKACTTTYGWYQRCRGSFVAQITLTGFAAGVAGNAITIPTPVTLANAEAVGGSFSYLDSGVGYYAGFVQPFTTTAISFLQDGSNNAFGAVTSLALAAADVLRVTMTGRYA